jgi:hypothetical protein
MPDVDRPNIVELMKEIELEAQRIEQDPVLGQRRRVPPRPAGRKLPPRLEKLWDIWEQGEIKSHRGLAGIPVVFAKRLLLTLLRAHNLELLRKQRAFNRAVLNELAELRYQLAHLSADVVELKNETGT